MVEIHEGEILTLCPLGAFSSPKIDVKNWRKEVGGGAKGKAY
jgi:hypothetical protein